MAFDKIITNIIKAEVGNEPNGGYTNDPADPGGRTQYGISEKSNPKAWADDKVTEQEAREIYTAKYIIWPRYHTIPPSHRKVQEQLIDWGVNSGPGVATRNLQTILGVEADGVFGPGSLAALISTDPKVTNNRLAAARVKMVCRVVQKNPTQIKYLVGLVDRALSFLIP